MADIVYLWYEGVKHRLSMPETGGDGLAERAGVGTQAMSDGPAALCHGKLEGGPCVCRRWAGPVDFAS
jgi:hypothetical protein